MPNEPYLCGDCLYPAQWNERRKQYSCQRCGY